LTGGGGYRVDGAAETGIVDSGVLIVGIVFGVVYINFLQWGDVTDMFFRSVYAETFGINLSSATV
jgi:hypothetical protein